MKLTYDPRYNIAYLTLRDKTEQVETLRVSDELNIDLAHDGPIHGIELLNANKQLAADNGGLTIINEASGKSAAVSMPA
jgi:uncharacterized protein YuzE